MKIMAEKYPLIYCWDVVNEAVSQYKCDLTRNSLWYDKFGDDYLDIFYIMADKYHKNNIQTVKVFFDAGESWFQ